MLIIEVKAPAYARSALRAAESGSWPPSRLAHHAQNAQSGQQCCRLLVKIDMSGYIARQMKQDQERTIAITRRAIYQANHRLAAMGVSVTHAACDMSMKGM